VVFDVEDESGAAFGAFDEAVNVVDVDLGLEEGGEDLLEVAFVVDFDGDYGALHVGEIVIHHERASLVGVVHDQTEDGGVGGVEHGNCHDVDLIIFQELGEVVEASYAILGED
jgi:hypothetical protein